MRPLRRPVTFLVACLEAALFAGQLTTLASTYWTSWDLKINWTQSLGDIAGKKPHSDGQVISEGHAGLWSRCIRVHGTGKDFNETKLNADKCLSIFADWEQWDNLKYGKTCKLATACLCVIELLLTCILLALIAATFFCNPLKRRRCLNVTSGCVLVLQGVLIALIPVLYVAGNMAELVEQLTSTYRLLMVVFMDAWYIHDWAYWLQVSLTVLWVVSAGLFGYAQYGEGQRRTKRSSSNSNGAKSLELPEMESLHVIAPSGK